VARPTLISALNTEAIRRELARRESKVGALQRRHQALSRQLAAVEAKIRAAGGEVGSVRAARAGGGRRRARNEMSLGAALKAALKGKKMGVQQAADAVLKAGFKTTSKNFRTMVAIQLGKTKGIKRVERGVYTAA